ncbi:hypothetical protein KSP40_PGU012808 [Platanthera guangdongensis]|uniref:Uncharacterized protein n=1 Tax=Platanthera guangdongensis TaxID=2320717 RepID=A0ABR2M1K9_9ASPA
MAEHTLPYHDLSLLPSSSSSSSEQILKGQSNSVSGNDNTDAGYHTPTSPRHRILQARKCPPAPRKWPARLGPRSRKRKAWKSRLRLIEDDEFDELVCSQPKKKKAKEDEDTESSNHV